MAEYDFSAYGTAGSPTAATPKWSPPEVDRVCPWWFCRARLNEYCQDIDGKLSRHHLLRLVVAWWRRQANGRRSSSVNIHQHDHHNNAG